jgi:Protein of unknown function DUF47
MQRTGARVKALALDCLPASLTNLLTSAATNATETAAVLRAMQAEAGTGREDLRRQVADCEATGDRITHHLVGELQHPLVADTDRPALLRLAYALDDVTDSLTALALLPTAGIGRQDREALAAILRDAARENAAAARAFEAEGEIPAANCDRTRRLLDEGQQVVRRVRAEVMSGPDPLAALRAQDWTTAAESALGVARKVTLALQAASLARV